MIFTLRGQKQTKIMNKLKFIKKFGSIEPGTILEYSDKDNAYVFDKEEETNADSESNSAYMWSSSSIAMTPEYAEMLIKNGTLEYVEEKPAFVNVFTEIDKICEDLNKQSKFIEESLTKDPTNISYLAELNNCKSVLDILNYLRNLKKQ